MSLTTAQPVSLLTKLDLDWAATSQRVRFYGEQLGNRTAADLRTEIDSSTGADQDALLYPLIVAAHDGNTHAERVLMQVLVPAAQRMAHRVRSLADFDRRDRIDFAIGAAWESIRAYRLHLQRRVMANLTMTLLSKLAPEKSANDRLIADQTFTTTDEVLEVVAGTWEQPNASPEAKIAVLFTWAVDTGVLTRDEIALLARAALGEESHQEIAEDLGVTIGSLRKRVDRYRWRLAAAAREQL